MRPPPGRLRPGALGRFLLHTRCPPTVRNAPYRTRPPPSRMGDGVPRPAGYRRPPRSHPYGSRPGHSGRSFRFLRSLPLQRDPQDLRQLFATHGSPPQNTPTRLRTQIISPGHVPLQNLRQGRYVFFSGALPTTVHQGLCMRLTIRLPHNSRRRASLFYQAQAPGRTVL